MTVTSSILMCATNLSTNATTKAHDGSLQHRINQLAFIATLMSSFRTVQEDITTRTPNTGMTVHMACSNEEGEPEAVIVSAADVAAQLQTNDVKSATGEPVVLVEEGLTAPRSSCAELVFEEWVHEDKIERVQASVTTAYAASLPEDLPEDLPFSITVAAQEKCFTASGFVCFVIHRTQIMCDIQWTGCLSQKLLCIEKISASGR